MATGRVLDISTKEMQKLYKDVSKGLKPGTSKAAKLLLDKKGNLKSLSEFTKTYGNKYKEDYRFYLYNLYKETTKRALTKGNNKVVEDSINYLISKANTLSNKAQVKLDEILPINFNELTPKEKQKRLQYKIASLGNRLNPEYYIEYTGTYDSRKVYYSTSKPSTLASTHSYVGVVYANYLKHVENIRFNKLKDIILQLTPSQAISILDERESLLYSPFNYSSQQAYNDDYDDYYVNNEQDIIDEIMDIATSKGINLIEPE